MNSSCARTLLVVSIILTLVVLGLLAMARGDDAPEFPFKNLSQLDGLPGWTLAAPMTVQSCLMDRAVLVVLTNHDRTRFWVVFVQLDGVHLTGAYYVVPEHPTWVYQGTYHQETGAITLFQVSPFTDQGPCTQWRPLV